MRLTQLRLVLWKNRKLQIRNRCGLLVELFVPLTLFLIIAGVRQTQIPEEVADTTYTGYALPSAGPIQFAQSLICGGVPSMDPTIDAHKTPLGQVAQILFDNPAVTPDRLAEALENASSTVAQLNATLSDLGLLDVDELSNTTGLPLDALEGLSSQLANISLPTTAEQVRNSTSAGNRSTPGSIEEWGNVNQTEARDAAGQLCEALRSTDGQAIIDALVASNGTLGDLNASSFTGGDDDTTAANGLPDIVLQALENGVNSTVANGTVDPAQIGSATDGVNELLQQLAGSTMFRDVYAPLILSQAGATPTQIEAAQGILAASAAAVQAGNGSTSDLRDQLEGAGLNQTQVYALLGPESGTGGNGPGDRFPPGTVPLSPVAQLSEELLWLQGDFNEFDDATRVVDEILEIAAIRTLVDGWADGNGSNVELAALLCPEETDYGSKLNSEPVFRRRRAAATAVAEAVGAPPSAIRAVLDGLLSAAFDRSTPESLTGLAGDRNGQDHKPNLSSGAGRRRRSEEYDDVEDGVTREFVERLVTNVTVFYSPDTEEVRRVIRSANATIDAIGTLIQLIECVADLQCRGQNNSEAVCRARTRGAANETRPFGINLNVWYGFADEPAMVAAALRELEDRPIISGFLGGIHFSEVDETAGRLNYSIRMHHRKLPDTGKYFRRYPVPGPGGIQGLQYYYSGFLWLQDMVDRGFTALATEDGSPEQTIPGSFVKQFPVPAYRRDNFARGIGRVFPLVMTLAWIYTVSMVCKSVVYEKETRLTEFMKIMGLHSSVHWLGWFITKFALVTVTVTLLTFIMVAGDIIQFSDPSIVWLVLELYGVSTILFAFLVSTFFGSARLASACGGLLYFVAYLPFIFVHRNWETMARSTKFTASVLPATAFGIFSQYIADFEQSGEGLTWDTFSTGLDACDNFTPRDAFGMLIFDCLLMAVLTAYFDAVVPRQYGVALPWYFFVSPAWWRRSGRAPSGAAGAATEEDVAEAKGPQFEPTPPGPKGICVVDLVKDFYPQECHCSLIEGKAVKVSAVRGISLAMPVGQIFSLLGHNGAGKSTTMAMICGLYRPTSGCVLVNGHDCSEDMAAVRRNLGVCPQYNVLFDLLTVYECLWFCARIKGMEPAQIDGEVDKFLADLGFEDKKDTYTKNLSGGQKRKLSVSMAFIGGSTVVMLDEPTAGMDPHARRSTWDLLLKYRKGRTILLTTHHMDEADILSDRIAIMARGQVQCAGSPLFLKRRYGGGLSVAVSTPDGNGHNSTVAALVELFRKHIPAAEVVPAVSSFEVSFRLPYEEQSKFATLFAELERNTHALGVESYGVSAPSMQEVFVEVLTREADADDDDIGDMDEKDAREVWASPDLMVPFMPASPEAIASPDGSAATAAAPRARVKGLHLWWMQFMGTILKRKHTAARDRKAMLSTIVLPAIFIWLAMVVATLFPPPADLPPLELHSGQALRQNCAASGGSTETQVPYADLYNTTYANRIATEFAPGTPGVQFVNLSTLPSFTDPSGECGDACAYAENVTSWLYATHEAERKKRRAVVSLEGAHDPAAALSVLNLSRLDPLSAFAWYDNTAYHASGVSLTFLDNGILLANAGNKTDAALRPGIQTVNFPLNKTTEEKIEQYLNSATDLVVAINVIIALSFVPASFVLFLVAERVSKAKHLQFVSGATPSVYWVASFLWDMLNYLVPCIISFVIFFVYALPAYTGRNFGCVCTLLLLYGWSISPAMYLFNWSFSIPSTAYVSLICGNLFVGLTTTMTSFVLEVLATDDPSMAQPRDIVNVVFLVFPNFCLGRGLMDIAKNEYLAQFRKLEGEYTGADTGGDGFQDPFTWHIVGKNMAAMAIQCIVFFGLTLVIEYSHGRRARHQGISKQAYENIGSVDAQDLDKDVAAERARVRAVSATGGAVLKVADLQKVYSSRGKIKAAVRGISFGVPQNECFGLLGVNGAGKTSTFKMLTGDTGISGGDAFVSGYSLREAPMQAKQQLGYCPQFDALLPLLSGRQMLHLFARLRGVDEVDRTVAVEAAIRRMQLTHWADRVTRDYSGGNKRKLSVALALIGNPSVLLLDEPTSGMDPHAQQFLWGAIREIVQLPGRSVIFTSHSMHECELLCDRLAIMVNGQFRCLGSPQHLKSTYGKGYSLLVKLRADPAADRSAADEASAQVIDFVTAVFEGSVVRESHHGYLHFLVPLLGGVPLSEAYSRIESNSDRLGIEDYTLSQTTLDHIFCEFAELQNSESTVKAKRPSGVSRLFKRRSHVVGIGRHDATKHNPAYNTLEGVTEAVEDGEAHLVGGQYECDAAVAGGEYLDVVAAPAHGVQVAEVAVNKGGYMDVVSMDAFGDEDPDGGYMQVGAIDSTHV